MKTNAFILILTTFATLLITGCEKTNFGIIRPSAHVSSTTYPITAITELDVADRFDVEVNFSDSQNDLRIEANENLHQYIVVEQAGGKLTIQLKRFHPSISGVPVLKVYLTTPSVQSFKAEGSTTIHVLDPWLVNQASIELTGASAWYGTLEANRLDADLSGASTLSLEGSVQDFAVNAEGACEMTGFAFEVGKLDADLSGACSLSLTVQDAMRVRATGASMVYYQGNAVIEYQNLTGGSQIIKR